MSKDTTNISIRTFDRGSELNFLALAAEELQAYRDRCVPAGSYFGNIRQGPSWLLSQLVVIKHNVQRYAALTGLIPRLIAANAAMRLDLTTVNLASLSAEKCEEKLRLTRRTWSLYENYMITPVFGLENYSQVPLVLFDEMSEINKMQDWCCNNSNYYIALGAFYAHTKSSDDLVNSINAQFLEMMFAPAEVKLECNPGNNSVEAEAIAEDVGEIVSKQCGEDGRHVIDAVLGMRFLLKSRSDFWLAFQPHLMSLLDKTD
jgi:hypothetical protein